MNIFDAIEKHHYFYHKNKINGGLSPSEFEESFRVKEYIKDHIIDAIDEGYKLVHDPDSWNTVPKTLKNEENKPTKEQWVDYLNIQKSGVTNMNHVSNVVRYSKAGLTPEICYYIMNFYRELEAEYKISYEDVDGDVSRV